MENTELLKLKTKDKIILNIRRFFKSKIFKKAIFITLFFFICYISTQLLNGREIRFIDTFSPSTAWEDRKILILDILKNFFECPKFIGNLLILLFMYLIVYGITNKTKLSCLIVSTLAITFGVVNYIVTQVRGIAITVSDVYSIQTAVSVAKGIEPELEGNFIVGMALYAIENIFMWRFCKFDDKKGTKTKRRRVVTAVLGVLCMAFLFMCEPLMDMIAIWDINEAYNNSGAGLTLIRLIRDLRVKRPDGYNRDEVRRVLSEYEDDTVDYDGDLPNILIVMNESFADMQEVFNIDMITDNLPYFHELIRGEDIVTGMMHSSKFGGGTANVEYEFLTQNTTAFLPTGAMPYQQYITKKVNESIVNTMNNLNYNTYGIHSWYKNGYSRGKVYNLLQFKNVAFLEDMPNLDSYITSYYPSDATTYEYWYDIMRNKPSGEKNFSFVLTMQNHLPYNFYRKDGIDYLFDAGGDDNEVNELNIYLQYANASDNALLELVNFIKNYDEDTILIFFGDHQPAIDAYSMYGSNEYSEDEANYVVPFFIWANYDIEEQYDIEVSTNYLQSLLFKTANLPMNSYTKYMSDLNIDIPVITSQYYKDKDGNLYRINDIESPYYDKIQEYRNIVYYYMFDNK